MNKKDILKNVYQDFFGIDRITRENEKLTEEIEKLKLDYESINQNPYLRLNDMEIPAIEVKNGKSKAEDSGVVVESKTYTKEEKDEKMSQLFEQIQHLYLDDASKELLKKILEYMRKYDENTEKQYISFDLQLISNNPETILEVVSLLEQAVIVFHYLKEGEIQHFSMFDVEQTEQIEEKYVASTHIVVLENIEGMTTKESDFQERFTHKLEECIETREQEVLTILVAKNQEISKQFLEKNEGLQNRFHDFILQGIIPDVQDAYQEIESKLSKNMELTDDLKVKLLDYVSTTYPNNDLPYPKYRDNVCQSVLFHKEIPKYEKEKTMEEIFEELNSLVGLEKVKQVLNDLVSLVEFKKRAPDDLKVKNINLHMIFLGNPGTGKTTVARIVAEILYNLKYVKQNKLIEVSSKDLVAEYVGQTAPKTMAVIQKALGGVLFVDEAYSLASGNGQGNSYNEEAIATLIQAMENYRDNLVVIFAGYTKEMQAFLNANSGIVSRIGYTLEFEDYTVDELIKIFTQMMNKSGFEVSEGALKKVEGLICEYKDSKNFGNARFVRNLYEKAIVKHATNTQGKKSKKALKTITEKDINAENLLK